MSIPIKPKQPIHLIKKKKLWTPKLDPTVVNFVGDFCLNNFFIGVVIGCKTTQSSPSTLWGGVITFSSGGSFTFFSSHAFVVFCEGEFVCSFVSKTILPKERDCDWWLPLPIIDRVHGIWCCNVKGLRLRKHNMWLLLLVISKFGL